MLTINLETQTAIRNGKPIIWHGEPVNSYKIRTSPVSFEMLETLYAKYKTSTPNGIRYKKPYFRTKTFDEMTPEELIMGENRQLAKERLELTLLEGVLNGSLTWPDDRMWFWQSPHDRDFIILKKWIQPRKGAAACMTSSK